MKPLLEQPMRAAPTVSTTRPFLTTSDVKSFAWPHPEENAGSASRTISRILNVVIAFVAVILFSPLMLIVAVLVRISSPGPIIYKQTRVGIDRRIPRLGIGDSRRKVDYGGRLFQIYKFRTMYANPSSELQIWADKNDKRITPIGRFLRQYRLDELPQVFNVLKGDMNLVGPRPEQPKIVLSLQQQISGYKNRQKVLPGITGWAQINHHYDQSVDDVRRKVALDLEYISRQSPLNDLRILARTIPVVLLRRGGW